MPDPSRSRKYDLAVVPGRLLTGLVAANDVRESHTEMLIMLESTFSPKSQFLELNTRTLREGEFQEVATVLKKRSKATRAALLNRTCRLHPGLLPLLSGFSPFVPGFGNPTAELDFVRSCCFATP